MFGNIPFIFIIFLLCGTLIVVICQIFQMEALIQAMRDSLDQYKMNPPVKPHKKVYDFIIIGAGTAGCVLANKLSENPDWDILLVEAGSTEEFAMDVPLLANYLQFSDNINWNYKTQPSEFACLGMNNGQCNWPRGKVIGGSSVLNYMLYSRGAEQDYDSWENLGNPGWSYKDVLPYFLNVEDYAIPEMFNVSYHSRKGHVSVTYPKYRSKTVQTLMKASEELGWDYVDYNSGNLLGISYPQVSIKDGVKHSSSRAYLYPVIDRPNLYVKSESHVKKILIDKATKKAYGIQYVTANRKIKTVLAKKEVILSAGAIGSPQLLMLSGVGPKEDLIDLDIDILQDLKVGYNLMDHITCGGITFVVNDTTTLRADRMSATAYVAQWLKDHDGPISVPGGIEAISFHDTENLGYPDLELLILGGSMASDSFLHKSFGIRSKLFQHIYGPIVDHDSFMIFPILLHPKSKGRIKLLSKDYHDKPLIYANYLQDPDDIKTIIKGIRLIQKLTSQPAMETVDSQFYTKPIPQCESYVFDTDAYWECATRMFTLTIYHYSGTCKMGPENDTSAVVNSRLQVYGIKNLRVIDASIMPEVISGHTNAPTYMIAEKGAAMIMEDYRNSMR